MKKHKNILIVGLFGLVIWVSQKIRAFQSMDLAAGFPSGFRLSGGTVEFTLPITVFNASGTAINIGGIDLRVYAEGQYIGRAYMSNRLRISGVGTTILPATVRVSLVDLANAIPGFVAGAQDRNILLSYQGTATVELFFAPVNFSHSLTFPKLI